MLISLKRIAMAAAVFLAAAGTSGAQTVKLEFVEGLVNLTVQNAPVRTILAEWARLGGTTVVNGDRVSGPPVTLQLTAVSERQALEIVLREVAGYMLSVRQGAGTGASRFDRLMILPTSTAPRPAPAPATFASTPQPVFVPNTDDGNPDSGADDAPGPLNRPRVAQPAVTARPTPPQPFVEAEPVPAPQQQAPPPPPMTPGNPFVSQPGSPTPGTISPVPQTQRPQENRGPGADR